MQELDRSRWAVKAGRPGGGIGPAVRRRKRTSGLCLTLGHEILEPAGSDGLTLLEGGPGRGRASEFGPEAAGPEYAEGLLRIMNASPGWSVLDIEGASGAQSILLARSVKRVKTVGFSQEMVDHVRRSCEEDGVVNLLPLLVERGKIREENDLGRYDAVVASGAALFEDLPWSVIRIDKAAKKKVLVAAPVGDGPFDRYIYESTGRQLDMGPSYTTVYYEALHQHLGILADIAFVKEKKPNRWQSREEALEAHKWMFRGLTSQEEDGIRLFLDRNLIRDDGMWRLPYEKESVWAIMWWEKQEGRVRRKTRGNGRSDKGPAAE
jgi:hypothetical protein